MAGIKIVTDSTSDISLAEAHELGIEIIPTLLQIDDQVLRAGFDINSDQFYEYLEDDRHSVSTVPPTTQPFEHVFRRLSLEYDHVFSIHMSGRVNGAYHAAQQARIKLPPSAARIEIIDSKLASMALGLVVTHAARAVKAGATVSQMSDLISRLVQSCHLVFFVDTIEYLEKSGRLGLATSVLGSMQRIKPLMLLDDGEIVPYERTRTRAKAIEGLYTFVEDFPHVEEVVALYATTPEDIEKLLEKLEPIFPREKVQIAQFTPSMGAYLGPGAMGVAVFEGVSAHLLAGRG